MVGGWSCATGCRSSSHPPGSIPLGGPAATTESASSEKALALACPTVLRSWTAGGEVQPKLVLLTATWLAAIGLLGTALAKAPAAARYLSESYRTGEGLWLVRMMRRLLG